MIWFFYKKNFFFFTKKISDKSKNLSRPVLKCFAKNGNGIGQSSVVIKKDILKRIGYISENKDMFSWEDFDTWIKVSKITNNFVRIPKVLASIWVGPENLSNLDRVVINNLMIKKYYKKIFFRSLGIENKKKNLWWLEYPSILNDFKKKKYRKCLSKISFFTNSPLNIKIRIIYIIGFSYFKILVKKIKEIFTVILLFKNKSNFKNTENTISVNYKIIDNKNELNNSKFINYKFPISFFSRMDKKDKFHILYQDKELICYGWSSIRNSFLISEINNKIKNTGNLILYDFKTLSHFRGKGYYQTLLKKMLNVFKDKDCYIYTTLFNKRSILSILKSGFGFYKYILFFNKNLTLK